MMHRRVGFLLFMAGWGANHFSTLLVVYRRDLGLLPPSLGILFGAYALGLVPGLVLAGRASDRRGRRALVLPAGLLAIAASALLAFGARGFAVLLAGRLLYGLAMGSIMSPGSVWVQELSGGHASGGARRATLALSAGFGLGPMVSGVIAELAPAPMVVPYVVHGLGMALALAVVRPVPETAPRGHAASAAGAGGRAPRFGRRELAVLGELLPVAPWAFGLAAVTIAIVPGLMRPLVAHPVVYSGLVILTTLLAGVAVQPLTRRVGPRGDLLGLGIGAAGVFLAARAVAAGSPPLAFVVALLVGSGYGLVMTTGLTEAARRVPPATRGTTVGIYYVLTYIGFALPFIHASVARRHGDAATLTGAATAVVIALLVRSVIVALGRRHGAVATY
jgi:MFS family permease